MRKAAAIGFVLYASLIGEPQLKAVQSSIQQPTADSRLSRLKQFLAGMRSPFQNLAGDFLAAADRHSLDWRLLPSIAVIESGAGKEYTNNNIFGWGSCKIKFPSVRAGIHAVAARLKNSPVYRDKGVKEILHTYNPNDGYSAKVMRVMRTIDPEYPVI